MRGRRGPGPRAGRHARTSVGAAVAGASGRKPRRAPGELAQPLRPVTGAARWHAGPLDHQVGQTAARRRAGRGEVVQPANLPDDRLPETASRKPRKPPAISSQRGPYSSGATIPCVPRPCRLTRTYPAWSIGRGNARVVRQSNIRADQIVPDAPAAPGDARRDPRASRQGIAVGGVDQPSPVAPPADRPEDPRQDLSAPIRPRSVGPHPVKRDQHARRWGTSSRILHPGVGRAIDLTERFAQASTAPAADLPGVHRDRSQR